MLAKMYGQNNILENYQSFKQNLILKERKVEIK